MYGVECFVPGKKGVSGDGGRWKNLRKWLQSRQGKSGCVPQILLLQVSRKWIYGKDHADSAFLLGLLHFKAGGGPGSFIFLHYSIEIPVGIDFKCILQKGPVEAEESDYIAVVILCVDLEGHSHLGRR